MLVPNLYHKLIGETALVVEGSSKLNRMMRILASGHFGIMTSWRSFATLRQPKVEGELAGIQKADRALLDRYAGGAKPSQDPDGLEAIIGLVNRKTYHELSQKLAAAGVAPLRAIGFFQEQGAAPASEATLVIPGKGMPYFRNAGEGEHFKLTLALMQKLAAQYNQDAFIYAGPETKSQASLFVAKRGPDGRPASYSIGLGFGKPDVLSAPTIYRKAGAAMAGRLLDDQGAPVPFASTQPARRGDAPGGKNFGLDPGKGGGVSLPPA